MNTGELEQRVEQLVEAHRALAARCEALMQVSKVMLAVIPGDEAMKSKLLLSAYDATNTHMDNAGFDEQQQAAIRRSMDEMARVILAGCS